MNEFNEFTSLAKCRVDEPLARHLGNAQRAGVQHQAGMLSAEGQRREQGSSAEEGDDGHRGRGQVHPKDLVVPRGASAFGEH